MTNDRIFLATNNNESNQVNSSRAVLAFLY
jgi:hypothetical protein